MKKRVAASWALLAGLVAGACSSDKAARETSAADTRSAPAVVRPAAPRPGVSAYASAPVTPPAVRPAAPVGPTTTAATTMPPAKLPPVPKRPTVAKPKPVARPAVARAPKTPLRRASARPVARVAPVRRAAPVVARAVAAPKPAPQPVVAAPKRALKPSVATTGKAPRPAIVAPAPKPAYASRPKPVVAATPRPVVAARPAARPAATPARKPRAVVAAVPAAPAAPAPTVAAPPQAVAAAPTTRAARRPTSKAAARPDSVAVMAAPVVRPLTQLASAVSIPTQTFAFDATRDTVLRTTEGTLVRVAAGAFVFASDTLTAATGPLTLRLREYATLPDLLLGNLTTRAANGHLLETAGAVWLDVTTEEGRPCRLRYGRDVHVALPVRGGRRPAMRSYSADSVGVTAEGLKWAPSGLADPTEVVRAMPPVYSLGVAQLENSIRAKLGFTPTLAENLLAEMPTTDRRRLRKEWSESGRVLRYTKTLKEGLDVLTLSFDVSENGVVGNWGEATGYHQSLRTALQQAGPALPGQWRPGTCAGRAVPMRARLLVLCYEDGMMDIEVRSDPDDWAPCEGPARAQYVLDYERRTSAKAPYGAEAAAMALRLRPSADLLGSRYLLDAGRLGWLMGHRVADIPGGRAAYVVPAGAADADVRLVFRRARTILAGTVRGTDAHFAGVPQREPVTVVAIRTDPHGQAWLAVQPAVTGEALAAPLTYRPVSVAELRLALAELEWKE